VRTSGRFRDWDPRHGRPCLHCSKPGHFADPCHLLECDQAPSALSAVRSSVLGRTAALDAREDLVKLLCNTLVGKAYEVPALRAVCPPLQRSRGWVVGVSGWARVGVTSRDALVSAKKATKQAKRGLCVARLRVPSLPVYVCVCVWLCCAGSGRGGAQV
jgi:hypothetical protein